MSAVARKVRDELADLESLWGTEKAQLIERSQEFAAYLQLVMPRLSWNREAYVGCVWIDRERSPDELEPDNDVTGFVDDPRVGQWSKRSGVNPLEALAASWIAASLDEPQPLTFPRDVLVNACAFSYMPKDRVNWASLDLDQGKAHAAKVLSVIRADVGDDAFMVHSGSGKKDRFRVLFRLEPSCEVRTLPEHFERWLGPHGFVQGEDYEVFPGQKHGRAMFGRNGCDWYSIDLSTFSREKPPTLLTAFLGQKPIFLRALANGEKDKVWVAPKRKATSSAPKKAPKKRLPRGECGAETLDRLERAMSSRTATERESFSEQTVTASNAPKWSAPMKSTSTSPKANLPRRYVGDRRSPVPAHVRDAECNGISGPKQRSAALYGIAKRCCYHQWSEEAAIAYIWKLFDLGHFDASKDANTPGKREQQKRQVPRLVRRVFATHEPPGRPEPVALTQGEYARVREYAKHAALASGEPEKTCLSFIHWMLSLMKAGRMAGLPDVRIHNAEMRRAGGAKYAVIRDACEGLFEMTRKHRSAKTLLKMGLSKRSALEGARARHYKTTFRFEK